MGRSLVCVSQAAEIEETWKSEETPKIEEAEKAAFQKGPPAAVLSCEQIDAAPSRNSRKARGLVCANTVCPAEKEPPLRRLLSPRVTLIRRFVAGNCHLRPSGDSPAAPMGRGRNSGRVRASRARRAAPRRAGRGSRVALGGRKWRCSGPASDRVDAGGPKLWWPAWERRQNGSSLLLVVCSL